MSHDDQQPGAAHRPDPDEALANLWALASQFPDADAAVAELARVAAVLTLPRGAVHVISDVHGEDVKLRHVINNASGALRPLIERLLGEQLRGREMQEFLALCFYPRRGRGAAGADDGRPGRAAGLHPADAAAAVRAGAGAGRPLQPPAGHAGLPRRLAAAAGGDAARAGHRRPHRRPAVLRGRRRRAGPPGQGAARRPPGRAAGPQPGHRRADPGRRLLGPRPPRGPRGRLPPPAAQRQLRLGQPRRGVDRRRPGQRGADLQRAAHLAPLPPARAAGRGVQHPAHPAGTPGPHRLRRRPRRPLRAQGHRHEADRAGSPGCRRRWPSCSSS